MEVGKGQPLLAPSGRSSASRPVRRTHLSRQTRGRRSGSAARWEHPPGALTVKNGGGVASRASRIVDTSRTGSASGRTERSGSAAAAPAIDKPSATIAVIAVKPLHAGPQCCAGMRATYRTNSIVDPISSTPPPRASKSDIPQVDCGC